MDTCKKLFLTLLVIALSASNSWGAPDADVLWDAEGVPITVAPGHQLRNVATIDGMGGTIVVWEDGRISHGRPDIYGQRIDADGKATWGDNGAPLITALDINGELASQRNPTIISDGVGGAIFTWEDRRNLQSDIYAQRVDHNGVTQWVNQGIPISTACFPSGVCANDKRSPQITTDGAEGAIITWYEIRDGFHMSVWAQKVDSEGSPIWTTNGVPVVTGNFHAWFPKIVSDQHGGAIIAWQDGRDPYHIYAQRLDSEGNPKWAVNGVKVSPLTGQSGLRGHSLISDGTGGVIIVWVDRRDMDPNNANIYAQKLDGNGQIQWQPDGIEIVVRPSEQYDPMLTTDGKGGAIIAWEDQGASPPGSGQQWIYAQRVSAEGQTLWTLNGIPIFTNHGFAPKVVSDGSGGAFIVWNGTVIIDPFTHIPSIFTQHVNQRGQRLWNSDGFVVYGEPNGHYGHEPQALSDGTGGVIIHWKDYRHASTYWDVYGQRLSDNKGIYAIPVLLELLLDE